MKLKRNGVTRLVFIFDKKVIKIPNFLNGWACFICGLLANMREGSAWEYNSGENMTEHVDKLCPVLWRSWGGWILVMRKADTEGYKKWFEDMCNDPSKTDDEKIAFIEHMYDPWIEAGFGGDDKPENYGFLDGRVVKIDYADLDPVNRVPLQML